VLERIASLSGGIGVISVGGHTDLEQKEKFDRVDDAVCAVRAAISEGIVAGGGVTLNGLSSEIDPEGSAADEIAAEAMMVALGNPMRQILVNSGMTVDEADGLSSDFSATEGIDVKTGEYGDMVQMGVIDPAKVTKTALRSAVSVANTILSTNAIVTMARSYDAK